MPTRTRILIATLLLAPFACAPPGGDGGGEAGGAYAFEAGDEVELVSAAGEVGRGHAIFVEGSDGSLTPGIFRGPKRLLDHYADSLTAGTYVFSEDALVPRMRVLREDEFLVQAADRPIEAVSLLGEPLRRPEITGDTRETYEANLEAALAEREANPDDPEAWIWVGRRLAYLGRYGEAIETFSEGQERWPEDPRFLRHRGHRHITTRRLEEAERDLDAARVLIDLSRMPDEVEPDGLPNARGIPVSTLHSNVRYHLALARYLLGDFEAAEVVWAQDVEAAVNPDMVVASSYWLWLTRMRIGRAEEAAAVLAPITAEMDIIENTAYHRLLLLFRGELSEEDLLGEGEDALQNTTTAYGVGAWHLVSGREDRAREIFEGIVAGDGPWAAFGYIAAEAELAR